MAASHPSGYGQCIESRNVKINLDITELNYDNTVPSVYNDTNNFVHFAGDEDTKPVACIFLIHGLHGSENDFANFVHLLKDKFSTHRSTGRENRKDDRNRWLDVPPTVILRSTINRGFFPTMRGVEEAALNALQEIEQCLVNRPSIKYLTIIGHSFGGVIARNMVEKLFNSKVSNRRKKDTRKSDLSQSTDLKNGIMDSITLVDLVLVASPCIGTRRRISNIFTSAFNLTLKFGTPIVAGVTGTELLLNDEEKIMYCMATKEKYIKALEKFNRRILYGNVFVRMVFSYFHTFLASQALP